jgi:hypothetical protein
LPNTWSRIHTGTPRNLCIGGWFGGNPYARGCRVMSSNRTGLGSSIGADRHHGVQQGPQPLPAGHDPADPLQHLVQQIVQVDTSQRGQAQRASHERDWSDMARS